MACNNHKVGDAIGERDDVRIVRSLESDVGSEINAGLLALNSILKKVLKVFKVNEVVPDVSIDPGSVNKNHAWA